MLAEAAPHLGTPNYQLLRRAYQEELLVEADYHEQFRVFRVVKLGWTERSERCLAWQLTPTTTPHQPGWRCYKVDELSSLYFGDPWSQTSQPDARAKPPECVVVVDEIKTLARRALFRQSLTMPICGSTHELESETQLNLDCPFDGHKIHRGDLPQLIL